MSNSNKPLYKGTFNYQRQVFEEFVRVPVDTPEKQKKVAFFLLTLRVAMQVKKSHYSIRQYFNGDKDNFTIKEVKE